MTRTRPLFTTLRSSRRIGLAALTAVATLLPAALAAQGLDLRAASQRYCLEEAEREGLHVLYMASPTPLMGWRPGVVRGDRVRMQVATNAGPVWIRCTYYVHEMRVELRRL